MLYSIILAFAAVAVAAPLESRQLPICTAGSPQCCATDVLGLADLNCNPPTTTPTTPNEFIATCSAIGQQAKCCDLPILGQALICTTVNPTA